jgi:coenzyme F420 hydrogenase subunit beta
MLLTLTEIVENGLCIGCGLCRSIAGPDQVELVMTPEGRERPVARRELGEPVLAKINAVCPGTRTAVQIRPFKAMMPAATRSGVGRRA